MEDELSLAELSDRAGVPPRTIRFYIAEGLLPGPLHSGARAVYGKTHVVLLSRIKKLQAQGMTLAEAAFALSPETGQRGLPEPVACVEYQLARDVIVRVRGRIAPWRNRLIRKVLAEMAAKLQDEPEEERTRE